MSVTDASALTPQEAWARWGAAQGPGRTVTAEAEDLGPDGLILSGVTYSAGAGVQRLSATLSEITLIPLPDGAVQTSIDRPIPLTLSGRLAGGEKLDADLVLHPSGLKLTASETAAEAAAVVEFTMTADSLRIELLEVRLDDRPYPMTLAVDVAAPDGRRSVSGRPPSTSDGNLTTGRVTAALGLQNPAGSGELSLELIVDSMRVDSAERASAGSGSLADRLRHGAFARMTGQFGAATLTARLRQGSTEFAARATLDSGNAAVGLSADRLLYEVGYAGLALSLQGSSLPFAEATLTLAEAGMRLVLPTLADGRDRPFALHWRLDDLAAEDTLWGLIDPEHTLPRTPARLALEMSGQGRWLLDIFDPSAVAAASRAGRAPGEIRRLQLDRLEVAAAGAALTGHGAVELARGRVGMDSGDTGPTGGASFRLTGVGTLLDRLAALGLLSPARSAVLRGLLGALTRPAEGADVLDSEIGVTPAGIIVNGLRAPTIALPGSGAQTGAGKANPTETTP